MKCNIPHLHYSKYTKHTTEKYFWQNTKKTLTLQSLSQSGCSTVGSAPRSGRGGRKFESSHPDEESLLTHAVRRLSLFQFR